ncbi:unnamed protein product [Choristocarpus tenellus]
MSNEHNGGDGAVGVDDALVRPDKESELVDQEGDELLRPEEQDGEGKHDTVTDGDQTCEGQLKECGTISTETHTNASSEDKIGDGEKEGHAADEVELVDDVIYRRVKVEALTAINEARVAYQLLPLELDDDLVGPATAHCRTMCESNFLSHWDKEGRKPYQRYSESACGQHIFEEIFGFDLSTSSEEEILGKIKDCIDTRSEEKSSNDVATTHLLDQTHTHIGLGLYAVHDRLRYVEVYADRYLQIIDAPDSLAEAGAKFHISVQIVMEDFGPYACLVYHDPPPTPLSVGELQHQFCGPYSDSTEAQVGVVWPWEMEIGDDGTIEIPVSLSTLDHGTYYLQFFVAGDAASIPYQTKPHEGLQLPGASFCGAALLLQALPSEAFLGVSLMDGDDECDRAMEGCTLEEKHAMMVASTTALRRDLAPIVQIKVVKEIGAIVLKVRTAPLP